MFDSKIEAALPLERDGGTARAESRGRGGAGTVPACAVGRFDTHDVHGNSISPPPLPPRASLDRHVTLVGLTAGARGGRAAGHTGTARECLLRRMHGFSLLTRTVQFCIGILHFCVCWPDGF